MDAIFQTATDMFQRLDVVWTFFLLCSRYTGLFLLLPGIGGGPMGIYIRYPAILVLSAVSLDMQLVAPMPDNWAILSAQISTELLFGFAMGMIPLMLVSGVQLAGHMSSTAMGLGAGNLMDPTLGVMVTDISRLFGDLTVILFLLMGGHHVLIYAVSGVGLGIVPGSLLLTDGSADLLIRLSADIFSAGVMMSAPVVVALLLTQFVMGLITKAVPTVNVFVMSFPLTIGIGLVLTVLSMPEIYALLRTQFNEMPRAIDALIVHSVP